MILCRDPGAAAAARAAGDLRPGIEKNGTALIFTVFRKLAARSQVPEISQGSRDRSADDLHQDPEPGTGAAAAAGAAGDLRPGRQDPQRVPFPAARARLFHKVRTYSPRKARCKCFSEKKIIQSR